MKRFLLFTSLLFFASLLLFLSSCKTGSSDSQKGISRSTISGAGATFPYPYYNIVFRDFMRINEGITVNYGAMGGGDTQLA